MERSGRMLRRIVLLVTAAAVVCTVAEPSGFEVTSPRPSQITSKPRMQPPATRLQSQQYSNPGDYRIYHGLFMPPFPNYDEDTRPAAIAPDEWLNKEIERINHMDEEENAGKSYDMDETGWIAQNPILRRMFEDTRLHRMRIYEPPVPGLRMENSQRQLNRPKTLLFPNPRIHNKKSQLETVQDIKDSHVTSKQKKEQFALTPRDEGYFDNKRMSKEPAIRSKANGMHEGGDDMAMFFEPPRQTRQNPNLSKTKSLVADNLDRLRTGLLHEEGLSTDKPGHVHILETSKERPESAFGVALLAAIGATITMAVVGLAIGWYTLIKKGKAAADVDYPAYGVTGPNIDSSGDRKLAHSAHMYHYQHQKQQIIAMERNGLEQRNGSVSDPESEEENEEGDYTVYECPGFATTGDMEVKNPLFSEDPTPATPGKCELVKQQPKE